MSPASLPAVRSYRDLFARSEREARPLSALLEITHRCHLDCDHCYLEDRGDHSKRKQELSLDELRDVVDQLHALGCLFLTVTGGETFLRPDLFDLLRHARSRRMAVILYTTGTLLTPARAKQLAELHLRRVELTVYSADSAVHDILTGKAGSHAKTLSAIELLKSHAIPVLIKSPLMRENFDSYQGLIALSNSLKVPLLVDPTVNPCNDGGRGPTGKRLSVEQLTAFFREPALQGFGDVEYRRPDQGDAVCAIGKRSCVVDPFGDVRTCLGYRPPMGNVRERSFASIWLQTPELLHLRAMRMQDLEICSSCEKFSFCNRCSGLASADEGLRDGPSSWACALAEAKERAAGLTPRHSSAEIKGGTSRRRLPLLGAPREAGVKS